MESPLNYRMIAHPINWVVIFLMLVLAGIAGHLVLQLLGMTPTPAPSQFGAVGSGQTPVPNQ